MASQADPQARERAKATVKAMFDRYHILAKKRPQGHIDFDHEVMNNVKIIDAGPEGLVVYHLFISKNFSNLNDVMHGGAAGVIFDMCTTTALCPIARPGYWDFMGGVTRTLNISYLKGVPLGTTVKITSQVMQVGRTMALIRGTMSSLDGKTIYCTCEHHKVNVSTRPQHVDFDVDGEFIDPTVKRERSKDISKL